MPKRPLAAIVLAAGKGTRMKSRKAKVLHRIGGKPMVVFPVKLIREFGADKVIIVVGHQAEHVKQAVTEAVGKEGIEFALQKEQKGTGHAVLAARRHLHDFSGNVLIVAGDVPLFTKEILSEFLTRHSQSKALISVLTTRLDNPFGYGRCIKDEWGMLARIVEQRDASNSEKEIREVNTGIYLVDSKFLFKALATVGTDNNQGEIYLTDIVRAASARDFPVMGSPPRPFGK